MDCGKFEATFGIPTIPWPDALGRVLDLIKTETAT
jgi:hypothetical protein